MPIPDSNQKSLAGEYYVSSLLSRMGYAVAITIGNAKTIDLMASQSAKSVNFDVKTTLRGYDWLVRRRFPESKNLLIAFVRLGTKLYQRPELYVLSPQEANDLLNERYKKHSPRIPRSGISGVRTDHDLSPVTARLGK